MVYGLMSCGKSAISYTCPRRGSGLGGNEKFAFHTMLANSLAVTVAEAASKRFQPDLNLEQKAKRCERTGVSVAKRLALVQAYIWAKHEEEGEICELHSPVELSRQFSTERLVRSSAMRGIS